MFPSFGGRFGSQDLGSAGVAPATRLATRDPGALGSPSVPTTRGCPSVGWTWQGEREKSRARDSEKVCPSRGSYGPKAKNRHERSAERRAPFAKGAAAEVAFKCALRRSVPLRSAAQSSIAPTAQRLHRARDVDRPHIRDQFHRACCGFRQRAGQRR